MGPWGNSLIHDPNPGSLGRTKNQLWVQEYRTFNFRVWRWLETDLRDPDSRSLSVRSTKGKKRQDAGVLGSQD